MILVIYCYYLVYYTVEDTGAPSEGIRPVLYTRVIYKKYYSVVCNGSMYSVIIVYSIVYIDYTGALPDLAGQKT